MQLQRRSVFAFFAVTVTSVALAIVAACSSDDPPPATGTSSSGTSTSSGTIEPLPDTGTSSGTSGTDSSSSGGVASDCGVFATVTCTHLFTCNPIVASSTFSDIAACQSRYTQECQRIDKTAGVAALPASCTNGAAAKPISCADASPFPPECAVKGALSNGIVCESGRQCQSGYCRSALPCGLCDTAVAENGSCESLDCMPGLLCINQVCKAKTAKDGICGAGECAPPNKCVALKCTAPLSVGSPCVKDNGEDDPCDSTKKLRCINGTCDAVTIAAVNDACGDVGNISAVCNGGAECVNKKCVARPADGAVCPETGPQCLWGATCASGTCSFPQADRCK